MGKLVTLPFIIFLICAFWTGIPSVSSANENFTFTIEEVGKNTITQNYGKPKYVDVEGEFAVMNWHENPGAIFLYNISDPKNPRYISHVQVNNGPNAVRIRNGYAYASLNTGYLIIASLNNQNITITGSRDFGNQMFNLDINDQGTIAVMAGTYASDGLVIIDTTNKANPTQLSKTGFPAGGVDLEGKYVFITKYDTSELRCYDISNPSAPVLINSIKVGTMIVPVRVYGNYAYVQEYSINKMHIVDISNPSNMRVVISDFGIPGVVPNGGGVVVDTKAELMFLATGLNGDGKVSIYDIKDKTNPKMISQYVYPNKEIINMIAIND
ncbi:MAG: hypothetical protein GYA60_02555, partial [Candidatus Methanofastidiosa archaeon]|nr:hypothetical protein [Candidatus Methanofastidiosa archaeon]